MSQKEMKIVNDIVHGIIQLPDYIRYIIDSEEFQRLRDIAQLGLSKFVYPSAAYSRFEHSIGTFHLASLLMEQLMKQIENESIEIPNLDINDKKCVEIAALCHDLGHGPFSHLWTHAFSIKSSKNKSHEKISVEIFTYLVNKNDKSLMKKVGLTENMVDKIGRIILKDYKKDEDENKKFLFEIVANKDSGLDVDKFDYLCRDSIYLGWSNKNKIHDIKRMMAFLRVVKDENGDWRISMRDREIFHIFDIFYYRHLLHRYGYQHKTVKGLEIMLKQALRDIYENEEKLKYLFEISGTDIGQKSINVIKAEMLYSKEFISKCCDYHIWNTMDKHVNEIFMDIKKRNFYKAYRKLQTSKKMTNCDVKTLEEIFKKCLGDSPIRVSVVVSSFALSSEGGNPIFKIPFYKKETPDKCFMFKEKSNPPPSLLTVTNEEFNILIFTNKYVDHNDRSTKIINDIVDKLCISDEVKMLEDSKNQLGKIAENVSKEITEKITKDIKNAIVTIDGEMRRLEPEGQLGDLQNTQEMEETTKIKDLKTKYKFRKLDY